jgi:UDP-N-acetyl-D-mannosaminuronic acid transferase (WecB/TagA/CpsF family)
MPDLNNRFVIAVVTQADTRIWTTGIEPGKRPETISAPADNLHHHHVRMAQHHGGHHADPNRPEYFEEIAQSLSVAGEILLIGHGKGKANSMVALVQFLERKHPGVALKVVGALDSNLDALSEPEILALAREWFDHYRGLN